MDGRRLKMLLVLDDYARESHAILVDCSIKAQDVVRSPGYLFSGRAGVQPLGQRS